MNLDRARRIEANAWSAYQQARRAAAGLCGRAPGNAQKLQRVIDEGARWQTRNDDYHEALKLFDD